MTVLDDDKATEILEAVEKIREFLPEAAAVADLAFPAAAPFIEIGERVLSAVFELVVHLRAHPTPDSAAEALRAQDETVALWREMLVHKLP